MITLKPGTPYAPISTGTDYQEFCDRIEEWPVTGDEHVDVEMTGGGTLELAAFRFGNIGATFFCDRENVEGLVIDIPGWNPPESELQPPEPTHPITLAPVITGLDPDNAPLFAATDVTVWGENFTNTSQVYFDGNALETNFVAGTRLTFSVNWGSASTFPIVVKDGDLESSAFYFTIT